VQHADRCAISSAGCGTLFGSRIDGSGRYEAGLWPLLPTLCCSHQMRVYDQSRLAGQAGDLLGRHVVGVDGGVATVGHRPGPMSVSNVEANEQVPARRRQCRSKKIPGQGIITPTVLAPYANVVRPLSVAGERPSFS